MRLESPESPVPATQLCEHCTLSGISPQAGLAARDPGLAGEPPLVQGSQDQASLTHCCPRRPLSRPLCWPLPFCYSVWPTELAFPSTDCGRGLSEGTDPTSDSCFPQ